MIRQQEGGESPWAETEVGDASPVASPVPLVVNLWAADLADQYGSDSDEDKGFQAVTVVHDGTESDGGIEFDQVSAAMAPVLSPADHFWEVATVADLRWFSDTDIEEAMHSAGFVTEFSKCSAFEDDEEAFEQASRWGMLNLEDLLARCARARTGKRQRIEESPQSVPATQPVHAELSSVPWIMPPF